MSQRKLLWLKQYPVIQRKVIKIIEENRENITKNAKEFFKEFPNTAILPYVFYVEELKQFKSYNKNI